jgi:hypothetical protein
MLMLVIQGQQGYRDRIQGYRDRYPTLPTLKRSLCRGDNAVLLGFVTEAELLAELVPMPHLHPVSALPLAAEEETEARDDVMCLEKEVHEVQNRESQEVGKKETSEEEPKKYI